MTQTRIDNARAIRSPRGPEMSAKSWLTEAPLRMLMNNLDPEVAEKPQELVVYGGIGRAARDWESFDRIVGALRELEGKGLMMYGQMTAGSWIYIGSQGIIQGTYETFAEVGRQHFGGSLAGRWILTGGLGGMGGAQPLAATMAGASMLAVECSPSRIEARLRTRYLDRSTGSLDEALTMIERSTRDRKPASV